MAGSTSQISRRFDPEEQEIPQQFLNMNYMAKKSWLAKYYDLDQTPFGTVKGRPMKEYLVNQREVNFREKNTSLNYIGMSLQPATSDPARPNKDVSFTRFDLKKEGYIYVDNAVEFLKMMKDLEVQSEIYVDIERTNSNCFQKEAIMLIQISTLTPPHGLNYLIDPLAVVDYIRQNLKRVFENPSIYKIFHDYNGDVISLLGQFKIFTTGIVDSCLLHQRLFPDAYESHEVTGSKMWVKRGLKDLVKEYLWIGNEESWKYYASLKDLFKSVNWSIRPIQRSQRHYAVGDSLLLMKLVNEWKKVFQMEKSTFVAAWKTVHDQINYELSRPGSKIKFTPVPDPPISTVTIIRAINAKRGQQRRGRQHFSPQPSTEKEVEQILNHRLYLAKVMDERPETILREKDLIQILVNRPSNEEEIRGLLCREAINYPCTKYWANIILRFFREGLQVFSDIHNTVCHKCETAGHPARFCPTFAENGSKFYEKNPEYDRINRMAQRIKYKTNAKFRELFPRIQTAVNTLDPLKNVDSTMLFRNKKDADNIMTAFNKVRKAVTEILMLGNQLSVESCKKMKIDSLKEKWTNNYDEFNDQIELIKTSLSVFPQAYQNFVSLFQLVDEGQLLYDKYWQPPLEPLPMKESKEVDRLIYVDEAQKSFYKLNDLCKKVNFTHLDMAIKLRSSIFNLAYLSKMCAYDKLGTTNSLLARNQRMSQLYRYLKAVPTKCLEFLPGEEGNNLLEMYENLNLNFRNLQAGLLGSYEIASEENLQMKKVIETNVGFNEEFADFSRVNAAFAEISNPLKPLPDLVTQVSEAQENLKQAHAFVALLGTVDINNIIIKRICELKAAAVKTLNSIKAKVEQLANEGEKKKKKIFQHCVGCIDGLIGHLFCQEKKDKEAISLNFKQTFSTQIIQQEWMTAEILDLNEKIQKITPVLQGISEKTNVPRPEAEEIQKCSRVQMNWVNCLYALSSSCVVEQAGKFSVSLMRFRTATRAIRQAEMLLTEIKKVEGHRSAAALECDQVVTKLKTYVFFRDLTEGKRLDKINYLSSCLSTEEI